MNKRLATFLLAASTPLAVASGTANAAPVPENDTVAAQVAGQYDRIDGTVHWSRSNYGSGTIKVTNDVDNSCAVLRYRQMVNGRWSGWRFEDSVCYRATYYFGVTTAPTSAPIQYFQLCIEDAATDRMACDTNTPGGA